MKRILLAALLALALSGQAMAATLPAQLKSAVSLEGDVIRLGDIWDNLAADKADLAIAAAPQPGKRISLEARWLAAVAQSYGIDWRPNTAFDRVVLERAGQTVDPRLIESQIREALALEGLPAGSDFEISNRHALAITIPANANAAVGVKDVVMDQRTNRFSATVEVPAGSPAATRVKLTGRVFTTTRVPVLSHAMNRGEVITERDIEWAEVREEQVRRDLIADPSQMIGLEPRWTVRQGVPLRAADLQRPVLVARNSHVTLVLKTPFMTLTAQGKAIEDGGKGDTIRVTNLQTKRTIEGKVDGPGTVSVASNGPRLLAN
ncbi:MAG TPA: flagellar basal body P-ring formation chaperone FlgA [Candidatus Omnitrophota bacterium]|nr:flagellar basal body P-ring formation chaperone FlgA [Candidatus Omnitrophota bacterium]